MQRLQVDWSIRTLALTYWLDCNDPLLCQVALALNSSTWRLGKAQFHTDCAVQVSTTTKTQQQAKRGFPLVYVCLLGPS